MIFGTHKTALEADLISKVEPVLGELGFALRDLNWLGGSGGTLRITLDSLSNSTPIGIEDCQKAHQILGPMFDVWDPVDGAYTLELSSPGEKPPLRTLAHFKEAVGGAVEFQTLDALPMPPPAKPRRNWKGTLVSVDETKGEIKIQDSMGEHLVNLSGIRSAQWMRDWTLQGAKEQGTKKG